MIEFFGITKRFGAVDVLRGVDLRVAGGRVTGVVGPNGAGKTTLIKTLLGLVAPTSGRIAIDGVCVGNTDAYRGAIGYMPQAARFPAHLTAAELFATIDELRGGGAGIDEEPIDRLALRRHLDTPLHALSGGTRQKVNACLALRYRPSILVLDEPTAGLDPLSSTMFKDMILAARGSGATVVVTSHIMSEIEELCDDVAFLLDGIVRYAGPVHELTTITREARLERAIAALMIREVA